MDLFDYMRQTTQKQEAPLAARMRPTTLEEIVGQKHIIGKGTLLYRANAADKLGRSWRARRRRRCRPRSP